MEQFNLDDETNEKSLGRELHFIEKILNRLSAIENPWTDEIKTIVFSNSTAKKVKRIRKLLAFLIGIIYGLIIFALTIYQITDLPESLKILICILLIAINSVGMASMKGLRCFMTLIIFNFLTSAGKVLVTTEIMKNLNNGPINHTIENTKSLVQSLICNYELFKNLTDVRKKEVNDNKKFFSKVFKNQDHSKGVDSIRDLDKDIYQIDYPKVV